MLDLKSIWPTLVYVPEDLSASDKFRVSGCHVISYILIVGIAFVTVASYLKTGVFGTAQYLHLAGMLVVTALVISYRFYINFALASGVTMTASSLAIIGIGMSSGAGIFDPALPFLYVSVLVSAVVTGWRAALLAGFLGMIAILVLGFFTMDSTIQHFAPNWNFENAIFKKVLYSEAILAVITGITAHIVYYLHSLFNRMEDSMEQVKQAERSKSRFLANMSHELRTPLNGVIGMSGLLMKTELNTQQHQYAQIVNDSSRNLVAIINDVLDISKLDAGMFNLRTEQFNVRNMLQGIMGLHSVNAQQKGLRLHLNIDPNIPDEFYADKGRIQQILNNLTSNAIKFTQNGSVTITVRGQSLSENNFRTEFYVSDTGIGLSQEDAKKVFERFHQVDNSLSRDQDGTGLGLSICREFVKFLGGEMKLVSQPGKGSTFSFVLDLPLCKPTAVQPQKQPEIAAKPRVA